MKRLVLFSLLFSFIFSNLSFAVVEITVEYPLETCIESWSCTDWSECVDGTQTRTCTDLNYCGTTVNKPEESRGCENGRCTENWQCSQWSSCIEGIKTRTCTDLNYCGTTVNKPEESRGCTTSSGGGGGGTAPGGEGYINYDFLIPIVIVVTILIGWVLSKRTYS